MRFCVHRIKDESETLGTYMSNFKMLILKFSAISSEIVRK